MELYVSPSVLNRIEFWRVRRKFEQFEPTMFGGPLLDFYRPVRSETIPNDKDFAPWKVQCQLFEKRNTLGCANVLPWMESKQEFRALTRRAGCNCSHCGNFLMGASLRLQNRRLAFWRPASTNNRTQLQGGFVGKHQNGVQFSGFFLMRGNSFFTQSWIRRSSRSIARLSGRCGLHPICARSLPT